MSSARGWPGIRLLVCFGLLCFYLLLKAPAPPEFIADPDMGIQTAGIVEIEAGEHPFIHFRSTYGPIRYYASYSAFLLTNHRMGSELLLCVVGYAVAYTLLFAAACRISGRTWIALFTTATAALLLPRFHKVYILLGPLLTLSSAFAYIRAPRVSRIILMGASVVFSAAYRLDVGLWALLPCVAVIADSVVTPHAFLRRSFVLGLALAGIASPYLLLLAWKGSLKKYLVDSTVYGASLARGLALPFPVPRLSLPALHPANLVAGSYCLTYLALAVALLYLACNWRRLSRQRRALLIPTAALALCPLAQTFHRSDFSHLLQGMTGLYLLMPFILARTLPMLRSGGVAARASAAAVLVALLGALFVTASAGFLTGAIKPPAFARLESWRELYLSKRREFDVTLAVRFPEDRNVRLFARLREVTLAEDRLLCLVYGPNVQFFVDRRLASGQLYLAPGYFSDEDGQRRMIASLTSQGLPPILEQIGAGYDGRPDRAGPAIAPLLYAFLTRNYKPDPTSALPPGNTLWRRAKALED